MKQSRISMLETPGAANVTLDTLSRIAAAFKVGVVVTFVPFSEMLQWENSYSQDNFDVVRINEDTAFLNPVDTSATAQQLTPAGVPAIPHNAAIATFYRPAAIVSPATAIQGGHVQPQVFFPLNSGGLINVGSSEVTAGYQYLLSTASTHQAEEEILTNVQYQNVPMPVELVAAATSGMNLYSGGANKNAN